MTRSQVDLELRPAAMSDVDMVADLETARTPDDPRDPAMTRFWWTVHPPDQVFMRMLAERHGQAMAYLFVKHESWAKMPERFGFMRLVLHQDIWNPPHFEWLVETAETWLRSEAAVTSVISVRADFQTEAQVLEAMGYRVVRRARQWELDLVANRDRLRASAEQCRKRMAEQGVRLLTLHLDTFPNRLTALYELAIEGERDVPTTVPMHVMSYDEWHHLWFDNPGIRPDRMWIAREGDALVGMSAVEYPPTRGVPFTAFTATARSVRGRGIARALKYETIVQAIALGASVIRTQNDGENAPILHINAEMGYAPIQPYLELHRKLDP
ncbi:MAG: GNAT family N-acetyltransferase [Chloroflexi bacterium]|nr:MAG: GNAT family N-acetyltransferase [Chloroflexota bacterium]